MELILIFSNAPKEIYHDESFTPLMRAHETKAIHTPVFQSCNMLRRVKKELNLDPKNEAIIASEQFVILRYMGKHLYAIAQIQA